ncbi:MAG: DNA primase catalytic subunit PriS [Candidatus ainarchaeum sp.]|nr:DNA primase catalytic subunit PriS [Candidatus ainarchaeum sp.]
MNDKEKKLALYYFSKYYSTANFNIPSMEKREFGVGFNKKIDSRHLSFENEIQLKNYLVNSTPFFISYSTAHYDHPAITPIEKKGWKGADLVFDLDVHTEGKYDAYLKLNSVKEDAIRLSEEFLQQDFGLSEQEITYVFSGNRGYHVHVRSDEVFSLGAQERREIVDYIRGVGLDFRSFFYSDDEKKTKLLGPRLDSSGYKGRFVKKVVDTLEKTPSLIYRGFSDVEKKNNFIEGVKIGNWSRTPFSIEKLQTKLSVVSKDLPLLSVDADAAVTYDIKKLIRMPNSIHGSTGFIAKEIGNIDSFNPLNDALPEYEGELKITFTESVPEIKLNNSTYSFSKGNISTLPTAIALFFILKESASLI